MCLYIASQELAAAQHLSSPTSSKSMDIRSISRYCCSNAGKEEYHFPDIDKAEPVVYATVVEVPVGGKGGTGQETEQNNSR